MVDSLADGVDDNPGNGVCSTAAGLCTVRAAVQESNALAGEDTINLGPGLHELSLQADGDADPGVGDLDLLDDVQLLGAGRELSRLTTLPGNRIIEVGVGVFATVSGVDLDGGSAGGSGGSVLNAGTLTLEDCIVRNGRVGIGATNSSGGGVHNAGDLTVRRCEIRNNVAASTTARGAGIGNLGIARISDSLIESNTVSGTLTNGLGGGLSNTSPGSLTVERSVVRGNSSRNSGGGLYSSGALTVIACSILSNDSGSAGGILFSGDLAEITNSTIASNTASGSGGGLVLSGGELRLSSSTVRENLADSNFNGAGDGGGVFVSTGTLIAKNAIIAGNEDGGGDIHPDCSGTLTSSGYNLILAVEGCTLVNATSDLLGTEPMLDALTEGARGTFGYPPLALSPVIDAATPAGCSDASDALLAEDQNGSVRAFDGDRDGEARCDIGAWERVTFLLHRSGFEEGETPAP